MHDPLADTGGLGPVSSSEIEEYYQNTRRKKANPPNERVEQWLRRRKEREDSLKKTRERLEKWAKQ